MTTTVAVLGTGIMGAAMARNLLKAGLAVTVWNRTPGRGEALTDDGATLAATPEDAVRQADVVLTMVFDGAAVREVMADAAPAMTPGTPWIQSTTVSLAEVTDLATLAATHAIPFFDAPVLGTRAPAEAGELTVLAAGPTAARDSVTPVFDAVGSRTVWTGTDAAKAPSTRLKLVANSWVIAVNNAAGETASLASALGVDVRDFLGLIEGGPLDNGYLRAKTGLILDDSLTPPSFGASTAAKDAHLIAEAAMANGARLHGLEAAATRLDQVTAAGHGDEDMAAAFRASTITDESTDV